MKSILFAGGALMLAATVYGVVDLQSKSRKQEFAGMYRTETPAVSENKPAVPTTTEPAKPEVKARKKVARTEKTEPGKPDVKKFVTRVDPAVPTRPAVKTDELKETKTAEVSKKSKRISHKLFSRGSLEDRYVEKTLKPDAPVEKTAPAKTEKKEE